MFKKIINSYNSELRCTRKRRFPQRRDGFRVLRGSEKNQKVGKIVLWEMDFLTDSRKPHQNILKAVGGDMFF